MVRLRCDDFGRIGPALEQVPFNWLFAKSVIDGLVDGAVWVDDARRPALVHVINPYGMTLLVVLDTSADCGPLRAHLDEWRRARGGLWLQVHPQEFAPTLEKLLDADTAPAHPTPDGVNVQRFTRVNFRFERERYASLFAKPLVESGTTVRAMTAAEFALPGITVSPHMFWRDADQFLSHGGGWCVCKDGVVSSIAFTSFRSESELELGVETRPEYRGAGHARMACAALIERCLASGIEPVWSCRKQNSASLQLAQALGFVPTFEGAYYHLPAINSESAAQPLPESSSTPLSAALMRR